VPLENAINARDLGGILTRDGRKVVHGRLFRADALSKLTDPDVDVLAGLGLRTVIDFRSQNEVASAGTDRLPPGTAAVALPVEAGELDRFIGALTSGDLAAQEELLGGDRAVQFMTGINRQFVADPRYRAQFGRALHLVADPGRQPALFHCSAGKDRTGWMSAIVLTALGVSREAVMADYLASNEFVWPAYRPMIEAFAQIGQIAHPDLIKPMLVQDPAYLEAAFNEADARYGSFESFLAGGLDFTPADVSSLRGTLLG
jgi:protein-tyrosine phosphatase